MNIIIPTLGRIQNQKTFNNLPSRWKEKVQFVVQHHEYKEFCNVHGASHVNKLPKEIDNIAATREWIHNNFKHDKYFVFDDDLEFKVKEPNKGNDTKWLTRFFNHEDFDDMFEIVEKWMDDGLVHGALGTTWIIPTLADWPYSDNLKIMTNVFYNGPKVPKDIEWSRVQYAEDFDVNLQLLTKGFKNRRFHKYIVDAGNTNDEGGCSTSRTLEAHNKSQQQLKDLWPDFIRITQKIATSGVWKGKLKLGTVIQHKKAYLSSIT